MHRAAIANRMKLGSIPCVAVAAAAFLALPMQMASAQSSTAPIRKGTELKIANASLPMRVLVESPAETATELQIICLFRSDPENTLHGSLIETNEKLKGLLDRIRKPDLFRGELGETMLLRPPAGSVAAGKLLIIGLGDSSGFTPGRMELVGAIAYREANRAEAAHPFFAPTVIDGGVTKYTTGEVAEQFIRGFLRGVRAHKLVMESGAAREQVVQDLTYLAGPTHAEDTRQGIEKAVTEHGAQ